MKERSSHDSLPEIVVCCRSYKFVSDGLEIRRCPLLIRYLGEEAPQSLRIEALVGIEDVVVVEA